MSQQVTLPPANCPNTERQIEELYRMQKTCQKSRKYMEADQYKRKINILKKRMERSTKQNIKDRQQEEKQAIEKMHESQLHELHKYWDTDIKEFEHSVKVLEEQTMEKHRHQLEACEDQMFTSLANKFKQSQELLAMRRTQELYAKQESYVQAHKVLRNIQATLKAQREKYYLECEKKVKQQLLLIRSKQQNELNVLRQKVCQTLDEKKKQREQEIQKLVQKYNNVKKQLNFHHNQEVQKVNKEKPLQKSQLINNKSSGSLLK